MSDDLVKRLRPVASTTFNLLMDSADRIEELERKLAKAVEMLRVLGVQPIVLAELEGEDRG